MENLIFCAVSPTKSTDFTQTYILRTTTKYNYKQKQPTEGVV